jgi:hypothetical protein
LLDEGLAIYDVADPTAPIKVGSLTRLGPVFDVAIKEDNLYCAAGWDSLLHYLKIPKSGPAQMEIVHLDQRSIYDFVMADNFIYAVDAGGLIIFDITIPSKPIASPTYSLPDAWFIAKRGDVVYVSGQSGTVTTINIVDHANPQLIASYPDLGYVGGMAFAGEWAYLPQREGHIAILQVADNGALTPVGDYVVDGSINQIVVNGAYGYVITAESGLSVLDLGAPTAPQLLSTIATPGDARDMHIAGQLAFIADGPGGLRVIDISDPDHLQEVGYYLTPDDAFALDYADGTLYVANSCGGLLVLRYAGVR